MTHERAIQQLVNELEILIDASQKNNEIQAHDLRSILTFMNGIVSHAFRDVLQVFADLKLLTEYDVRSRVLASIARDAQLLRYAARTGNWSLANGEFFLLKDLYGQHLLRFVEHHKFNREAWPPARWLIEDKIQRTNLLIDESLAEIDDAVNELKKGDLSLELFQGIAREKYNAIRSSQEEFFRLNSGLLGF